MKNKRRGNTRRSLSLLAVLFIALSYRFSLTQAEEFTLLETRIPLENRTPLKQNILTRLPVRVTKSNAIITIDKAVAIAIENNLQLKAERERLKIAQARLATVMPFLNPELESEAASSNQEKNAGYSLKITQEFEIGRKRAYRREAAKINIEKVKKDIENKERKLIAAVREASYTVILLKEKLALMDKSLVLNEKLVKDTIDKFQSGYIPQLEVNLAKIQLQEVIKKRAQFFSEFFVSLMRLKRLLGKSHESDLKIRGSLDYYPLALRLDKLINYSLINRPDLKSLEFELRGAKTEIFLWQAERLPNIKLFSSFARETDNEQLTGGGISIPLPLFDRKRGQIDEAKAQKRKVALELANLKQLISNEVAAVYSKFNLSKNRLKLYREETINLVEEGLELSKGAYQRGEVGFLEVLLAQEKFTQTKISYLEALYDYNISVINLEKAIAGRLIDAK